MFKRSMENEKTRGGAFFLFVHWVWDILKSLICFLLLAPWRTRTWLDLPVRDAVQDGGQEPGLICECAIPGKMVDKNLFGPANARCRARWWTRTWLDLPMCDAGQDSGQEPSWTCHCAKEVDVSDLAFVSCTDRGMQSCGLHGSRPRLFALCCRRTKVVTTLL